MLQRLIEIPWACKEAAENDGDDVAGRYIIVESASWARLHSDRCLADDLDGLERLYKHLREDTRLIANSLRSFGFAITNCAGTNVTAYSSQPMAEDDTLVDAIGDLTRAYFDFKTGLGTTLAEAFKLLHRELSTAKPPELHER